jgi:hypothetical protein
MLRSVWTLRGDLEQLIHEADFILYALFAGETVSAPDWNACPLLYQLR